MEVVYEDNHLIIVNKAVGEIVQGDKTGDSPLSETVKQWIKEKYAKPGKVFLGVVHRLDRPVAGLVVFAKTSKALARLNNMFRDGKVQKVYRAIVKQRPPKDGDTLVHYISRNERLNKSFASVCKVPNSKKASLLSLISFVRQLPSFGNRATYWPAPSDSLPARSYGLSYQGRFEIRIRAQ